MIEFHIVHVEILMRYFNWIWSARFYFRRNFAAVCCCRFIHLTQFKCPFVLSLKAVIIIIIPTSHTQSRSLSFSLYSAHFNSSLSVFCIRVVCICTDFDIPNWNQLFVQRVHSLFRAVVCDSRFFYRTVMRIRLFLYYVSFGAQMVVRTICY